MGRSEVNLPDSVEDLRALVVSQQTLLADKQALLEENEAESFCMNEAFSLICQV